ncbi:hypothetical protein SRT_18810 [Streptococcus troglodytae]|uniref:Uncharacterized protein n=1 Tax=Streptococcus troglodytae TaxID=1111760 RepID=A0A1L7LM92_9STRE|nr:hypothetical protein SRT_18810 [Streptococcus troglodytae]
MLFASEQKKRFSSNISVRYIKTIVKRLNIAFSHLFGNIIIIYIELSKISATNTAKEFDSTESKGEFNTKL